jgi:hypothetical protein
LKSPYYSAGPLLVPHLVCYLGVHRELLPYGNLMPTKSKAAATFVFRQGDVLEVLKTLPPKKYSLIISSPPYNIGKGYEKQTNLTFEQYVKWLDEVIGELVKFLAENGSICWQVGSYIKDGEIFPLDLFFIKVSRIAGSVSEIVSSGDSISDSTQQSDFQAGTKRFSGSPSQTTTRST